MRYNRLSTIPQWVAIPGLFTAAMMINIGTLQADDNRQSLIDWSEKSRKAINLRMDDRLQEIVSEAIGASRLVEQVPRQMLTSSDRQKGCTPTSNQTINSIAKFGRKVQG